MKIVASIAVFVTIVLMLAALAVWSKAFGSPTPLKMLYLIAVAICAVAASVPFIVWAKLL